MMKPGCVCFSSRDFPWVRRVGIPQQQFSIHHLREWGGKQQASHCHQPSDSDSWANHRPWAWVCRDRGDWAEAKATDHPGLWRDDVEKHWSTSRVSVSCLFPHARTLFRHPAQCYWCLCPRPTLPPPQPVPCRPREPFKKILPVLYWPKRPVFDCLYV